MLSRKSWLDEGKREAQKWRWGDLLPREGGWLKTKERHTFVWAGKSTLLRLVAARRVAGLPAALRIMYVAQVRQAGVVVVGGRGSEGGVYCGRDL